MKATASGASPLVGVADALAPRLGETTTLAVAVDTWPLLSLTVSVAVYVPAAE